MLSTNVKIIPTELLNQNKMNNTVLITGASRGIGAETARLFAQSGYNLIINCNRNYEALLNLKEELERSYHVACLAIQADVSSYEAVKSMFLMANDRFGGVDILINNAGICHSGLLTDLNPEDWHRIIDTNLSSVFYSCKEAVPYMVNKKRGSIINVSSVWGLFGASCEVAYSASKGGINAFTKALAKELGPSGIKVNAIAFGIIDTDMNKCYSDQERQELADETALGRFSSPEEAASFIYDIACNHNYLTGQVLQFDGGWI